MAKQATFILLILLAKGFMSIEVKLVTEKVFYPDFFASTREM
jgi:hypothetical protein